MRRIGILGHLALSGALVAGLLGGPTMPQRPAPTQTELVVPLAGATEAPTPTQKTPITPPASQDALLNRLLLGFRRRRDEDEVPWWKRHKSKRRYNRGFHRRILNGWR